MKKYVIYAGVNGAGKSTLYRSYPHEELPRINTDEMVSKMGSWRDPSLQAKAGVMAVRQINEYFQNGISFNQETTLSGRSIMKNIMKAKSLGYQVEMHYVGLESPEVAKKRVAARVEKGGHGIPDEVIEKRYAMSIKNLCTAIKICNIVTVYDNSDKFEKIAEFKNGNRMWQNDLTSSNWLSQVENTDIRENAQTSISDRIARKQEIVNNRETVSCERPAARSQKPTL